MNNELISGEKSIQHKIHFIRGVQVMLDTDLAELYAVETKQLNRAVKRNKERFPLHFCFQLNELEYNSLMMKIATLRRDILRYQNGTLNTAE